MRIVSQILLLLVIGLLCGCAHRPLTVQTQYFSLRDLASFRVDTPDPLLNTPPIGQRLLISWDLKQQWNWYEELHLKMTVRYRNREEVTQDVAIYKACGDYTFTVANQSYIDTGGIRTYKIELIGDGMPIHTLKHQLWNELITF